MPRVSLLMSAYNREPFVAQAIQSVRAQTFRDLELLVWDDGSTDGTLARAREAAASDPRIQILQGDHVGVLRALNQLAQRATGEFIGWVDSDDALAPLALAETVALLDAKPEVGMVYTNYITMDEAGRQGGLGKRCQIAYSKDRLLIDFMTFHFRLIRKSIWDHLGGLDPLSDTAEDYDLCLRVSEITQIHHLPRALYIYRVHPDSISSQRRLDQIHASQRAIERALIRRNMHHDYELKVEIIGRFHLRRKSPQGSSPDAAAKRRR
jgi:glycosyltransferase involved in cell wall biosynthesis